MMTFLTTPVDFFINSVLRSRPLILVALVHVIQPLLTLGTIPIKDWNQSEQCIMLLLFVGPSKFPGKHRFETSAVLQKSQANVIAFQQAALIERLSKLEPAESAGEGAK